MQKRVYHRLIVIPVTLALSLSLISCDSASNKATMAGSTSNSAGAYVSGFDGGSYKSDSVMNTYSAGFSGVESIDSSEYIAEDTNWAGDEMQPITSDEASTTTSEPKQSTGKQSQELKEEKLVYRCNINLETMEYDETYNKLKELIDKFDCRIESEDFRDEAVSYNGYYEYNVSNNGYKSNKTNTLTIRVPSKNYQAFVDANGELGNIVSKSSTIENITQQYYDTTAEVDGLRKQLARLQAMMDEAYIVEDMIEINREITNVQGRINSLETNIRTMDMDTAYSYVKLHITEVVEYTEYEPIEKKKTFIDRLKNQVAHTWEETLDSAEELLFWFISIIPTLLILIALTIVIRMVLKKKNLHPWLGLKSKAKKLWAMINSTPNITGVPNITGGPNIGNIQYPINNIIPEENKEEKGENK